MNNPPFLSRMTHLIKIFLLIVTGTTLTACTASPTAALPTPSAPSPTATLSLDNGLTSTPALLPQTEADVPRVSPAEAKAAFEHGEAIIVDVRTPEAYALQHIKGAVNGTDGLDKSKWIITYCT